MFFQALKWLMYFVADYELCLGLLNKGRTMLYFLLNFRLNFLVIMASFLATRLWFVTWIRHVDLRHLKCRSTEVINLFIGITSAHMAEKCYASDVSIWGTPVVQNSAVWIKRDSCSIFVSPFGTSYCIWGSVAWLHLECLHTSLWQHHLSFCRAKLYS